MELVETVVLGMASISAQEVPTRVVVTPWGAVESEGGDFVVDEESAQMVIDAFESHGTDLPIDYEHQTLGGSYSSPSGQAPAAGWVKCIEAQSGAGLVAEIEWTEPAIEQLKAKQYRYLSPVALIRKSDRKLAAIHSIALTNKPAIARMEAIVNRAKNTESLPLHVGIDRLRTALAMDEECGLCEIVVAAGERLAALARAADELQAERRIEEAVRAGKLSDGMKEWAKALILKDESLFEDWLEHAPSLVAFGATKPPRGANDVLRAAGIESRARAEYRSNATLAALTSEDAYVADAVRTLQAA